MDISLSQKPGIVVKKNDWRLRIGLLLAGVLVGGLATGGYFAWKLKKTKSDCTAQVSDAKKATAASATAMPKVNVPSEIFNVSGTVEKIDGNTVTVKSFSYGQAKTYNVKVVDGTKIIKREMIDPSKSTDNKPATPFKDSDAQLSDLREKDTVSVDSSDNVKDKTEFEAKIVYIQISNLPVPPAPPAPIDVSAPPSAPGNVPPPPAVDTSKIPAAPPAPPVPSAPTTPAPPK